MSPALMEKTACFQGDGRELFRWHLPAFDLGRKLREKEADDV